MTFLEMQTAVGELINQAVTDDTKTITETEVKRNLNIGYGLVKNAVVATNQSFYLRLAKADLVEDQSRYSLPTDLRRISRVEVGYTASTTRERVQRVDRNAKDDPNVVQSEGRPAYYVTGDMIELDPEPSSDVTDGLWLWYIEDTGDMSDDDDEPNLPKGWEYLPVLYAASKAKRKVGLNTEAESHLTEFKLEIADMKDELMRLEDSLDYVVVRGY